MASNTPLNLSLIVGSTREGRVADLVTRWAASLLHEDPRVRLDVLDLAALELPISPIRAPHVAKQELALRVGRADAFIVVTPEYNHGYPAVLKAAIDHVYHEWQAKPVGFISYGGISGGLRAVEQLRQVFAELHAVTIRNGVSFAGAHTLFDEQGHIREPEASVTALQQMLGQLLWWAASLREARLATPYPG